MRVSNSLVSLFLFVVSAIVLTDVNGKHINKNKKSVKIVNGDEVKPHSMPYMVAIRTIINDKSILCGGSLVTKTLVLTAAKCVSGATEAEITLGAHNLDELEASQLQLTSSAFIIHENYSNDSLLHDIALIELPSVITLNENVKTVLLPTIRDITKNYDELLGVIAGWGKAKDTDTTTSSVLLSTEVTIIPTLICELSYLFSITADQMCTSGISRKNICLGDAGSPLIVDGVQVGIASYGSDFGCEVGLPGVYTRLTSYLGWLLVGVETYGEKS